MLKISIETENNIHSRELKDIEGEDVTWKFLLEKFFYLLKGMGYRFNEETEGKFEELFEDEW